MDELIKRIRICFNMSQQEFAELLHVNFATVNRWENGHSKPNESVQMLLYQLCRSRNISVYDMTMERISRLADNYACSNRMVLYHGSKSGIDGDIRPISRSMCDFGKGFYMGTIPEQPLTLISDFESSKFYIVSIDLEALNCVEIPADIDWAMVVALNRGRIDKNLYPDFHTKYTSLTKGMDMVIGYIANDKMFEVLDDFFQGLITDKTLVECLSALKLGKQYVAITQRACNAVKIEAEIPLSYLERLFVSDVSMTNRRRGRELAKGIYTRNRRDGLFFDEILGGD